MSHWISRSAAFVRSLCRRSQGSVAIIFAISSVPVVMAAGVGIDITRASIARNHLQDSLDAAALALAHMPAGTSQAALNAKAQSWMDSNLNDPSLGPITLAVVLGTGQVDLTATSSVATTLTAIAGPGFQTLPISAHSQVKWGIGHVEVALVLDNTGSMAGQKIADLKNAANSLVDSLAAAAAGSSIANPVKISLVPYTMTVNVGPNYSGSTWLSPGLPTAYGADIFNTAGTDRLALFQQMGTSWAGCVEARPSPYDVTESPPSTSNPGTLYVPFFAPDEPGSTASDTWNSQTWYNNYLADVSNSSTWSTRQGYEQKYTHNFIQSGTSPIGYPYGPNAGCQIQPLTRLTTNFANVKTAINAMTAGGDTDIKAGVMWGWHTLSPNAPFNDGIAYGTPNYTKVMILMTDGQNHNVVTSNGDASVYSGIGYIWQNRIGITSGSLSQRITVLDQKLALACTNAKAAGIVVYSVVLLDNTVDQSTVRNCASSPDKTFDVSASSGLTAAFNSIAGSISQLRIAQ